MLRCPSHKVCVPQYANRLKSKARLRMKTSARNPVAAAIITTAPRQCAFTTSFFFESDFFRTSCIVANGQEEAIAKSRNQRGLTKIYDGCYLIG